MLLGMSMAELGIMTESEGLWDILQIQMGLSLMKLSTAMLRGMSMAEVEIIRRSAVFLDDHLPLTAIPIQLLPLQTATITAITAIQESKRNPQYAWY